MASRDAVNEADLEFLARQEKTADWLDGLVRGMEPAQLDGVLTALDEVLEKGRLLNRLRGKPKMVRSDAGVRRYDQPINTPIVADVDKPGRGDKQPRDVGGDTGGAAGKTKAPRWKAEGWGGPGGLAGRSFIDSVTGRPREKRPTTGKYAAKTEMTPGGRRYFGRWTPKEYADAIKEGQFDTDLSPGYKALWIDDGGGIHAVEDHRALPDKMTSIDADNKGWMHVAIASRHKEQQLEPLTDPMLDITFKATNDNGGPTSSQIAALDELMKELDTGRVDLMQTFVTGHWWDAMEQRGTGDGVEVKGGSALNELLSFDRDDPGLGYGAAEFLSTLEYDPKRHTKASEYEERMAAPGANDVRPFLERTEVTRRERELDARIKRLEAEAKRQEEAKKKAEIARRMREAGKRRNRVITSEVGGRPKTETEAKPKRDEEWRRRPRTAAERRAALPAKDDSTGLEYTDG